MLMTTLQTIWYFISDTPVLVPVLLWPLAAWLGWRTWQPSEGSLAAGRWAAAATLAFGLLDGVLLAALPRLGLSFGPVGFPLLGITGIRLGLSLLSAGAWRWAGSRWPDAAPGRGPAAGLALLWLINFGVLACEIDGLYVEPFNLRVTELTLPGPSLRPGKPLRILQLSDLHVERTTKRERETIEKVNALEPDIIVLTGDYLNLSYVDDPVAQRDARALLAQLHAPYGVYAITARTVDPPDAVAKMFTGLDITLLHDEVRQLQFQEDNLYLVGIPYLDRKRDQDALRLLMSQLPQDAYALLLYHTPDLIDVAAQKGVNLYLAGHTHGGQIRLPLFGALITASAHGKKYEQGRYTVGQTTLYVSRGIGMEGRGAPRARFLCPPEIVVVNLENVPAQTSPR